MPKSWTGDAARRQEARIPDDVTFRTKPELALEMIRRAVADELPPGVVLADSAYGDSCDFREQVRLLNLKLLASTQHQTGYEVLPIARVEKSQQAEATPQLDETYILPLLACEAWKPLAAGILQSIYDRMKGLRVRLST